MSSVTGGMRRRTEKKKSASVDCSRRNSLMDRSERSLRTVRLARLEFPQNRKHQIRTTLTLKNGIKRIEHEMKQLDAESLSTKRKISKMVHVLESGMDQLIEKMMRRKFELMDELQQIGDDERDRIVKERKSLQKRLVSMQKEFERDEAATHCLSPTVNDHGQNRHRYPPRISLSHSIDPRLLSMASNEESVAIPMHEDAIPLILSVRQKYVENVSHSANLNTLHITWELDQVDYMAYGDDHEIFDPSRRHKLCVECAYLPFTTELPPDHEIDLEDIDEFDFTGSFELDLPQEEVLAVYDGNSSVAVIDGPERHRLVILQLYYSTDGGMKWSDPSKIFSVRYSPKLELTFDPNRAGYSLRLGADGRSVECTQHDDLFHTALFGIEVTASMCRFFRITFKVRDQIYIP